MVGLSTSKLEIWSSLEVASARKRSFPQRADSLHSGFGLLSMDSDIWDMLKSDVQVVKESQRARRFKTTPPQTLLES